MISWSFGNDFAINVIVFGVDNSSSSRISSHDKRNNSFLGLAKLSTDDINESISGAEKKFSVNFSKAKTEFCLSLHYSCDKCLLPQKKSISLNQIIKMSTFKLNFAWEGYLINLFVFQVK